MGLLRTGNPCAGVLGQLLVRAYILLAQGRPVMDGHLNWTQPHSGAELRGMLKVLYPNCGAAVVSLEDQPFKTAPPAAIVEAPRNIWGAWRLGNGKAAVRWALAGCGDSHAHDQWAVAQETRLRELMPGVLKDPEAIKVPSVTVATTESGPAAVFNVQWLMERKKKSHPGPGAYLRVRQAAYSLAMKRGPLTDT